MVTVTIQIRVLFQAQHAVHVSWENVAISWIDPGSISCYLLIPASYRQVLPIFGIFKPYAID